MLLESLSKKHKGEIIMVETCECSNGCGVDLEYEGNRQWVCPICNEVYDLEGVDGDEESLSAWEAAEIWVSHGKDEEYTFGYSEEELEDAL